MNVYALTGRDMAAALLGAKRVKQSVHRVTSTYGGKLGPRYVVLVVPPGEETGEYYQVSERVLEMLQSGQSPEYLELEPHDPDEDEQDEYEESFARRRRSW